MESKEGAVWFYGVRDAQSPEATWQRSAGLTGAPEEGQDGLGAGTALHIPPMREKEHESGCGKSSSGPAQPAAQLWDLSGHSPSLASASNQSNYGLPGGSLAPRTGRLLISPNPTRRYKPRPCRGANCSRLLTISGSQVGTVRSQACHLQRWR